MADTGRAQIENFCFHDPRHTFAMKGGNIYALAKILGHASPKMSETVIAMNEDLARHV